MLTCLRLSNSSFPSTPARKLDVWCRGHSPAILTNLRGNFRPVSNLLTPASRTTRDKNHMHHFLPPNMLLSGVPGRFENCRATRSKNAAVEHMPDPPRQ